MIAISRRYTQWLGWFLTGLVAVVVFSFAQSSLVAPVAPVSNGFGNINFANNNEMAASHLEPNFYQ